MSVELTKEQIEYLKEMEEDGKVEDFPRFYAEYMHNLETQELAGAVKEKFITSKNDRNPYNRILIGTATRGTVRMEWAQSRFGQVIPTNWMATNTAVGFSNATPIGYLVDDAQNIIVRTIVENDFEWLLFVEDDVIMPMDAFLKFNEYMKKGDIPVVSGLYCLKASNPEPLVYRGRGNSCYADFQMGDLVWADGIPTGCLLIHSSILKLMWQESEQYSTLNGQIVRRVFETPRKVFTDPERRTVEQAQGTSDLYWCDRVMREKVLERSGWEDIAKKEFPFLVDTNIACDHIDITTGMTYPIGGFMRKG